MKKIIIALVLSLSVFTAVSQTLNGAWRLTEQNNMPTTYEVIKLYSNSYFTYASYNKETGEFLEAKAGMYTLKNLSYKEHLEIDSSKPENSGTSNEYHIKLNGKKMIITHLKSGEEEVWEKFDEADNYKMASCWRIHKKKDEGDTDWRTIEYAPRKTLKMITNSRYQVIALNSETGQFVGSSGGNWSSTADVYIENVEFFSKNQKNVGRSLHFNRNYEDGIWLHSGKNTKGELMMEEWIRYK
jgi:hypothetical protein